MDGAILLVGQCGMGNLGGYEAGWEVSYVRTCNLMAMCRSHHTEPLSVWHRNQPVVSCVRKKIEGWKYLLSVLRTYWSGGMRPPFGLDPSPHADSASGFRMPWLFLCSN
jgi:hypothetical protein